MKIRICVLTLIFLTVIGSARAQNTLGVGDLLKMMDMKYEEIEKIVLARGFKKEKEERNSARVSIVFEQKSFSPDDEKEITRTFTFYNVFALKERSLNYSTTSRVEYDSLKDYAEENGFEKQPGEVVSGGYQYKKGNKTYVLKGVIGYSYSVTVDNIKPGPGVGR